MVVINWTYIRDGWVSLYKHNEDPLSLLGKKA